MKILPVLFLGIALLVGCGGVLGAEEATSAANVLKYRKAAERGDADFQCILGDCYAFGDGVPKDATEAVKWYRKAAEQGLAAAQNSLGLCYEDGDGVPKDAIEAAKWYRKAAEQGHAAAQNNLGWCYDKGNGVAKDATEAVKWWRKAAWQGNAIAQFNLGWCYDKGNGVAKDATEAVKWYRKAAEQGDAVAQNNLGWRYANGDGVPKDATEAVKWYRKSAEQGDAYAQNNLGVCYQNGEGVAKDYTEAVKWYNLAAASGHENAKHNREVLEKRMTGDQIAAALSPLGTAEDEPAKFDVPKEVRLAVFLVSNDSGKGTAFACTYRDKEFVATNLHVASGTTKLVVKTQGGDTIPLADKIILAGDADICLIAVSKPFAAFGVTPLEFSTNVFEDAKVGDDIYCLGNSLGNGVVIQADGKIKAFGNPRFETTTPFVGGNSGGPLIHAESKKVIGLVTETIENRGAEENSSRDERAIESGRSELDEISYIGHRIDSVQQWSGTSFKVFLANEKALAQHEKSLRCMTKFLRGQPGWREDRDLVSIYDKYSKFVDDSGNVTVTDYVDEDGRVVWRDFRVRGKSVSKADHNKAYRAYIRGLEGKAQDDVEGLEKLVSLGYIQVRRRANFEKWSKDVKTYIADFQDD